jgi:hypothetical protein
LSCACARRWYSFGNGAFRAFIFVFSTATGIWRKLCVSRGADRQHRVPRLRRELKSDQSRRCCSCCCLLADSGGSKLSFSLALVTFMAARLACCTVLPATGPKERYDMLENRSGAAFYLSVCLSAKQVFFNCLIRSRTACFWFRRQKGIFQSWVLFSRTVGNSHYSVRSFFLFRGTFYNNVVRVILPTYWKNPKLRCPLK